MHVRMMLAIIADNTCAGEHRARAPKYVAFSERTYDRLRFVPFWPTYTIRIVIFGYSVEHGAPLVRQLKRTRK